MSKFVSADITEISPTKWMIEEYRNVPKSWEKIIKLDYDKNERDMLFHLCRVVLYNKQNNDFDALDELLLLANVKSASEQLIVSVLRLTYSVRHNLKSWNTQLEYSIKELNKRNLNANLLLRGLV